MPAKKKRSIIAVDFDGTCVTHEYPEVGREIGATPILLDLLAHGHKLILFTMRSRKELDDAVKWFKERNIHLWGINNNPTQRAWTVSPKVHAHLYIDDAGACAPLIIPDQADQEEDCRPYIDWEKLGQWLHEQGYLS